MFLASSENVAIRNRLIERLKDVPIGGFISHRDVNRIVGRQKHLFEAAKKIVEKEDGMIFENVFGEGYKRITNETLPEIGRRARKEIASKARIAQRRMINGSKFGNGLDRETRLRLNQELGVIGTLREMAKNGI